MASKRRGTQSPKSPELNVPKETDVMSSVLTDSGETAFLFELDDELENAVQPATLPDGEQRGVIKSITVARNNNNGVQWRIRVEVPPENYPADFPMEHAPEGISLMYFSRELGREVAGDTVPGRWELRRMMQALQLPGGRKLRAEDVLEKPVKFTTATRELDDGSKVTNIKGLLEAI